MIQAKSDPTHCDVILSHSVRDEALAAVVKQKLADVGLSVFGASGLDLADGGEGGAEFADAVLKALVESSALVALITPAHRDSPALGVEVGAAWIQHKPIYVLVAGDNSAEVPPYLRRFQVYPLSRLPDAISSIVRTTRPLAEG
jgi:hypothetical protein